jgi:WD40 repeat protein
MAELTTFGIEQDFEFTGHLSLATHLVPMPKKTFATSDDTQIRVWGRSGDIAKMTYPKNKRSMVSAMTFCASHSLLLTAEIDMSFKAYSVATLDLLDTFKAEQKIAALAFYGPKDWLIAGGETGLEVWKLVKSPKRRIVVIGRYEHHFQLEFFRKLDTSGNILGINSEPSEERLIVWSSSALYIFDTGLTLLVACNKPHSEPIKCVAIQILSIIDTAVITGGQDCLVKFWNISNKQVNQSKSDSLDVFFK